MATEEATKIHQLEISRTQLPGTDYVVLVTEIWQGDRNDPATSVSRYMGMWEAGDVPPEGELPLDQRYGSPELERETRKQNLVWESLGLVQGSDRDYRSHRDEYQSMTAEDGGYRYSYGISRKRKELYVAMLNAVDIIAEDENNKEAWAAIDAYREYWALEQEK